MSGFNLPPGVSVADINRLFDCPDPSTASCKAFELLEPIREEMASLRFRRVRALAETLNDASEKIGDSFDGLTAALDFARRLLEQALPTLPTDPVCNCNGPDPYGMHAASCSAAGSPHEYGEPTLREEIAHFLEQSKEML